jgi:hypothetical protein
MRFLLSGNKIRTARLRNGSKCLEADCQTPEFRGQAHGSPVETSSASDAVDGSPDTRSACLAEGIGREHWNQQLRLDREVGLSGSRDCRWTSTNRVRAADPDTDRRNLGRQPRMKPRSIHVTIGGGGPIRRSPVVNSIAGIDATLSLAVRATSNRDANKLRTTRFQPIPNPNCDIF